MDAIILIATLITTATVVAFVIISKGTPEMSVKSMLRSTDRTQGDKR
jgi:hypothetical protein